MLRQVGARMWQLNRHRRVASFVVPSFGVDLRHGSKAAHTLACRRRSVVFGVEGQDNVVQVDGQRKALPEFTRDDYLTLVRRIRRYDEQYYSDLPTREVSDEQYDKLLDSLERIEAQRPDWIDPSSPTLKPGYAEASNKFPQVVHERPMLSLSKTYSVDDLEKFVNRIANEVNSPFCVELKIDGVALRLTYKKGELILAATRGDGTVGDDVTRNAFRVRGIPANLPEDFLEDFEITGEVCILNEDFQALKEENESLSNVRNSAAGALKLLDPDEVGSRRLTFIAYEITPQGGVLPPGFPSSQSESLKFLKKLGFRVSPEKRVCGDATEIVDFVYGVTKRRHKLPMEVDGIVVKVDDNQSREDMGKTRKSPKGAVAHKFSGLQATTKIQDVVFQVSRYGSLTPVALLEPVGIAGVTISRATLNNPGFIEDMGIRIGDFVTLERGGDVIPKIVGVEKEMRPKGAKPFEFPTRCPSCESKLVRKDRVLTCENFQCHDRVLRQLVHFSSKEGVNIDGLGERTVEQLFERKLVESRADFFRLTVEDFLKLDKTSNKKAEKLVKSIKRTSETCTLTQLIVAFGIPGCGANCAKLLGTMYPTLDELMLMDREDLVEVVGMGLSTVEEVVEFFTNKENLRELDRMKVYGVLATLETAGKKREEVEETHQRQAVLGKSFVFTGTLENMSREKAADIVRKNGGSVRSGMSKRIDYIVVGENAGKKLEEAKNLGVSILNTEMFLELVE